MVLLIEHLKIGEGKDLFSVIAEGTIRFNGLTLQEGRFQLNIRRNLLTMRDVQQ